MKAGTADPTAGDRHERYRLVGDRCPVLLQRCQVVAVERGVLQPLDRAEKEQLLGHRLSVAARQVDFDVVAAGPVPADRRSGGQEPVRQEAGEGFPNEETMLLV